MSEQTASRSYDQQFWSVGGGGCPVSPYLDPPLFSMASLFVLWLFCVLLNSYVFLLVGVGSDVSFSADNYLKV